MSYNSGKVTASVPAGITVNASQNTATVISGEKFDGGSTVLGTVPAGKRWRIVSAQLSTNLYAAGTNAKIIAGTQTLVGCTHQVGTSAFAVHEASQTWAFDCCPIAAAGETVTVTNSTSGPRSFAVVAYVEEAV